MKGQNEGMKGQQEGMKGQQGQQQKTWPNVIGLSGQEAREKIQKEMPDAQIELFEKGSACTKDYKANRVRICVDNNNKVVDAPKLG